MTGKRHPRDSPAAYRTIATSQPREANRSPERSPGTLSSASARDRFKHLDAYRVDREWQRLEGTAQRDLFRELRERFLRRNAVKAGWVVEVGPGPGRFSRYVGGDPGRQVLLDLSREMLGRARSNLTKDRVPSSAEYVRADGLWPPIRERLLNGVVLLGNLAGFAGDSGLDLLNHSAALIRPEGRIIIELAPDMGERSSYLHRLPASAVGRLFRAPPHAVYPRIIREGFDRAMTRPNHRSDFRRFSVAEASTCLGELGFELKEIMAVAPALGPERSRIAAAQQDPISWENLLIIEERLGRDPLRWTNAAAVLLTATRGAARTA